MNAKITVNEATKRLQEVNRAQAEINRRSAKEYAPWVGWGFYAIVVYPLFDFLSHAVAGSIAWVAAIIGTIITYRYFKKRHNQVKTTPKTPWAVWILYGVWIGLGVFLANMAQPHFAHAWSVAGLAVGVPFVLYGLKQKSQA